jgi:hypothetical protein
VDTLDKEMIHVSGSTEQNSKRYYHATQNGLWFKIYRLLISGIIHLVFSDQGSETTESKASDRGTTTTLCDAGSVGILHLGVDC